ncbi:hypothetical protein DFJ63DRAFT_315853 [Scheffersomyces coipomensis]|uniref:uncharacterized protein n=1 Tax=Scheffersomyces coipomensis TaxID=1788519 RepID=UPI00315CD28E
MVSVLPLYVLICSLICNVHASLGLQSSFAGPQFNTIVNWTLTVPFRSIQTMPVVDFVNRTWIQVETPTLNNPRLAGNFTLIELKAAPFDLIKKFQGNTNAKTIINNFSSYKYNFGLAETLTYKLSSIIGAWSQNYIYIVFHYLDLGVEFAARFIKSAFRLAKSYDCGGQIVEFIIEGDEIPWMVYVGTWTLGETCQIPSSNQIIIENVPDWIKEKKDQKDQGEIEAFTVKVDHNNGQWFSDVKFCKKTAKNYPWLIPNLHIPNKYL